MEPIPLVFISYFCMSGRVGFMAAILSNRRNKNRTIGGEILGDLPFSPLVWQFSFNRMVKHKFLRQRSGRSLRGTQQSRERLILRASAAGGCGLPDLKVAKHVPAIEP